VDGQDLQADEREAEGPGDVDDVPVIDLLGDEPADGEVEAGLEEEDQEIEAELGVGALGAEGLGMRR
jgi:hypothetical protein